MKQNKTYLHLGVTLVVSACAVLMFYDTFFQSRVLLDFFDKLMSVLSPVIYGLVFAYLLAPIVDFFDRYIQKGLPKVKSSLVRGLSILVTWICVIALIYLMFSILIPELVDSMKTLADNFESYYKTVYNWVNSLVENQTIFSDDIYSDQLLSALNGYYDKLVKWVTDTVIPQAQVAIVAVTGGIWSVIIFLKNLLIGMMISVYLLARKESFAKQSKKILYAILPETPYRRTLRAVAEADRIFSGFVRGKLLDSLIIGILCFIGGSILNLPYTPLVSRAHSSSCSSAPSSVFISFSSSSRSSNLTAIFWGRRSSANPPAFRASGSSWPLWSAAASAACWVCSSAFRSSRASARL